MTLLQYLQSQQLIYKAQIAALERMREAKYFAEIIYLKAGLEEINRQIDELMGDIL